MMMEILGVPEPEFIEKGCRTKKFFVDFKPKIKPNAKGYLRKPGSKSLIDTLKCDNPDFVDFISKTLVW